MIYECVKMPLPEEDYYSLLTLNSIEALSPAELAREFEISSREWYHVVLNESDFSLLVCTANAKWYSICRCHVVSNVGITSDEHMHALVHFVGNSTLTGFKKKLQRVGKQLQRNTAFKKIVCLDQAVGILRNISCKDGHQIPRCDGYAQQGTPLTYSNKLFDESWLHEDEEQCDGIRNAISELASDGVQDLANYMSRLELHDKKSCLCDRGEAGRNKKEEANRKRREFYLSEKGLQMKKKHKEKLQKKQKIVQSLVEMMVNNKAELQRQTVIELVKLL